MIIHWTPSLWMIYRDKACLAASMASHLSSAGKRTEKVMNTDAAGGAVFRDRRHLAEVTLLPWMPLMK
jgi:hypothetical protein